MIHLIKYLICHCLLTGDGLLDKEEASKLLVLMCHARSCNGTHNTIQHAQICQSTKFLMLHIRDCNSNSNRNVNSMSQPTELLAIECDLSNTSSNSKKEANNRTNTCKLPWCSPCKKMLLHLTRCYDPSNCLVCNPW